MELLIEKFFGKATSSNSGVPPSQDLNREKKTKKPKSKNKSGGQLGHKGKTLEQVENPEETIPLLVDKRKLPKGKKYKVVGYEKRQVFEYKIVRYVKEYLAEILEDEDGNRFVADFPAEIKAKAQYGTSVRALVAMLSVDQVLPYERLTEVLKEITTYSISQGTIANYLKLGFEKLEPFEDFAKEEFKVCPIIGVDETGININKKLNWIHSTVNEYLTLLIPHESRGHEAIDYIGILPNYKGYVVHDGLKAYIKYEVLHVLCNGHHLRELNWVTENTDSTWSKKLHKFLTNLNKKDEKTTKNYLKKYNKILDLADKECPEDTSSTKQTKERNLIKRLRKYTT